MVKSNKKLKACPMLRLSMPTGLAGFAGHGRRRKRKKSMKKGLSLIMSLVLAVQPAFGAFEGVKQKAVSAKEAMVRSRAVLKENWQCFRSGTGPNCTKEQRSALRIIHDFVTGKWVKAKAGLKKFYDEPKVGVFVTVHVLAALAIVAAFLATVAGIGWLMDTDRKRLKDFLDKVTIVPSKQGVDAHKVLAAPISRYVDDFDDWDEHEGLSFIRGVLGLRTVLSLQEGMNRIDLIASLMEKLGWNSTFNGRNLIDFVNDNQHLNEQDKEIIIQELKKRGVKPAQWQYAVSQ